MGKMRRMGNVIRRMAGLVLALVLGFSGITGHVTAYAAGGDVKDGATTAPTPTYIQGTDVYFDRDAVYIAVTPVYESKSNKTTDTEVIMEKNPAAFSVTSSTYETEEVIAGQEGVFSLPAQNAGTLLFVSYSMWKDRWNFRTQRGAWRIWMRTDNATYSKNGSNMEYKYNDWIANIVMAGNGYHDKTVSGQTSSKDNLSTSDWKSTAKTGVFRSAIKDYLGKGGTCNVDFSSLTDKAMSEKEAKALIAAVTSKKADKNLKLAQQVWNYITDVTGSTDGGTVTTEAGERYQDYLIYGYNTDIAAEENKNFTWSTKKKYDSSTNGLLLPLTSESGYNDSVDKKVLSTKGKDGENPDANYCNDLYNLGTLDLMLCAYVIAENQGAKAASYWKDAIVAYLTAGPGTDPGVRISMQVGIVVRGQTDSTGNYYHVFATANDLVTKAYGLNNATGAGSNLGWSKTEISMSVTKPYSGFYKKNTSDTEKDKHWFADTSLNKESLISKTGGTPGGALKAGTYKDYYTRLAAAAKAAKKTAPEYTQKWYSHSAVVHVLNGDPTTYSKLINDTQKETAYIELLRARNPNGYKNGYVTDSWGGGYYAAHGWRANGADSSYTIGARLEISSALYDRASGAETWKGIKYAKDDTYTKGTDYFTAAGTTYAISEKAAEAEAKLKVTKIYGDDGKLLTVTEKNPEVTTKDSVKLKLSAHAAEDSGTLKDFLEANAKNGKASGSAK